MMASIEQVSMSQKTTGIQLFSLCFHLCIYIYISYTNEYIYIYMRMYKMLADCHLNTRVQPSCLGPWYLGFLLALVGNISTRVHPHVWGHDLWSQSVCLSRHHLGSKDGDSCVISCNGRSFTLLTRLQQEAYDTDTTLPSPWQLRMQKSKAMLP
jgi:hypothetical protein